MKARIFFSAFLLIVISTGVTSWAQQGQAPDMKQKFMQAQKANTAALREYTWKSQTEMKLKGETKKVKMEQVLYGPDGKLQKTPLDAPQQAGGEQQGGGGGRLKQKIVAKKKEEFAELAQDIGQLVASYAHIPPEQMQSFIKDAQFGLGQGADQGTIRIAGQNAVQPGDTMNIWINKQTLTMHRVEIVTALENKPVTITAEYSALPNGPTYQARAAVEYPEKKIQVLVENFEHNLVQPRAQAQQSAQPPPAQQISPEAMDKLLAPIALYPDALVGQVLMCSMSPFQVGELSAWLKANPNLKGTVLQEAAQKEGFDPSFVALASFPQVVNMMADQLDWTRQLGQAFAGNRKGVMESVQRLRSQAMAAGTLKDTPQQDVQTQTTQSGQQVIVVQPANPQVIYVPQYNPQVVYTQPTTTTVVVQESSSNAGAAAVIGFTAGVILGAAANNNYWGPYAMYEEAWDDFYDHREDMAEQYYEHRENMAQERTERQGTRQEERTERQGGRQENTSERQTGRQESQGERQTGRDENQTSRQTGRQEGTSQRQTTRQEGATARQGGEGAAAASSSAASRGYSGSRSQASTQQTGTRSGAFSGYQSGQSERAASSRGRSSMSSSGGSSGKSRKRKR